MPFLRNGIFAHCTEREGKSRPLPMQRNRWGGRPSTASMCQDCVQRYASCTGSVVWFATKVQLQLDPSLCLAKPLRFVDTYIGAWCDLGSLRASRAIPVRGTCNHCSQRLERHWSRSSYQFSDTSAATGYCSRRRSALRATLPNRWPCK
jgi:hypothetical protein